MVLGSRPYFSIEAWAAATLLFRRAVMGRVERPLGVRRPGRCAVEAQEVIAEEERPMRAVRRGGWEGIVGWMVGWWMGGS